MGCGHSKLNIYPKKNKKRSSPKKSETQDKSAADEIEKGEEEADLDEKLNNGDSRKTIKVKAFGGPLLAQVEISASQQNFFRMLDEKIENGPDYDSASEKEKAVEAERIRSLLKDWETASAGSRSLPSTPCRKLRDGEKPFRSALITRSGESSRMMDTRYHPQITSNMYYQQYNAVQSCYRQTPYNPEYQQASGSYSSAMQYQVLSPMYITDLTYPPPPNYVPSYSQHNSPAKTMYHNNSIKHIPYEQPQVTYSPSHKLYGPVIKNNTDFTNGKLLVQQQIYNQQLQYQQTREYHQLRQTKEQMLIQQQNYQASRSYQNNVHMPISVHSPQTDVNVLHRKQYELT